MPSHPICPLTPPNPFHARYLGEVDHPTPELTICAQAPSSVPHLFNSRDQAANRIIVTFLMPATHNNDADQVSFLNKNDLPQECPQFEQTAYIVRTGETKPCAYGRVP